MLLSVTRVLAQKSVFVFTTAMIAPLYLKLLGPECLYTPFESNFLKSKPQSAENESSLETKSSLC